MRLTLRLTLAAIIVLCLAQFAAADTIVVTPSDDGSIYTCDACNHAPNHSYVLASGYIVGEVDFATSAFLGHNGNYYLAVNPYALPLFGSTVHLYGLASNNAFISINDLANPTFIGDWNMPGNPHYGQDIFFDVTGFMHGVNTPYVDFILRTDNGGTDVFSSLEYNYGHPSELIDQTPEPGSLLLLFTGLTTAAGIRRRRA